MGISKKKTNFTLVFQKLKITINIKLYETGNYPNFSIPFCNIIGILDSISFGLL